VPFFGVEFSGTNVPDVETTLISEAAIDYIKPSSYEDHGKKTQFSDETIYEYNGRYFAKADDVEDALLIDIYKNPERYLASSRIFTDATLNDVGYKISKDLLSLNEAIEGDNRSFSKVKYAEAIEQEKQKYVDYVFKRNFEQNQDLKFTDGFGNVFSTRREALDNFNKLINDTSNIKSNYLFEFSNGDKQRFEEEEEYRVFVHEHQVLDKKDIRKSRLLNTTTFNNLESVEAGVYYSFVHINYYGELRYFRTMEQA